MFKLTTKEIIKYSIIFFLVIVSIFIIKSFLIPLLFTVVMAFILNPIYQKIKDKVRSHIITFSIITIILLVIVIAPLTIASISFSKEATNLEDTSLESNLIKFDNFINGKMGINVNMETKYNKFSSSLDVYIEELILKIPIFLFNLFLIFFFYYYISKDFNSIRSYLYSLFEDNKKARNINSQITSLIEGIIYGQIFVRFIQAIIGTFLFFLIGVNNAIIYGTALFFVSFLPVVGTALVWFPITIFYILKNDTTTAILIFLT